MKTNPHIIDKLMALHLDVNIWSARMRNFTENGRVVRGKTATSRSEATLDFFLCL